MVTSAALRLLAALCWFVGAVIAVVMPPHHWYWDLYGAICLAVCIWHIWQFLEDENTQ